MPAVTIVRKPLLSPQLRLVLELLADGRSGREIAAELFVAPSTVAGYLRKLYAALGVHSGPQAVARGHQLGLLPGAKAVVPQGGTREVLELVLARDFERAYGLALEVVAQIVAAEQDAAAAGRPGEARR